MARITELNLAKELIKFPSITPKDAGAISFLSRKLKSLGFNCKILEFKDKKSKPIKNLYARLGKKSPNLCYAGHTDVVPPGNIKDWTVNPFKPTIRKNHLIGRGANDMKSSIACFVSAVDKFLITNKKFNGSISFLIISVDSVIAISVGVDGVIYFELFGEEESDNEVDFSIMKPLPQVYMDSNELFETIFQQATINGEDIVNMILPEIPSGSNLTMDMEVRIMHDYWGLPVDLAPELIPVTWHMNMYATAMDSMGYVVMEDSLSMFMDAGTGELLYASKELTNIEEEYNLPLVTTLHQNYPNPFNPTTSISFELNKAQDVSLVVYNLLGQKVLTLVNDRLESGQHRINLNASNLASGIYMYRLTTNSQSLTKKMTLIK